VRPKSLVFGGGRLRKKYTEGGPMGGILPIMTKYAPAHCTLGQGWRSTGSGGKATGQIAI